jgi:hypothetical protein
MTDNRFRPAGSVGDIQLVEHICRRRYGVVYVSARAFG